MMSLKTDELKLRETIQSGFYSLKQEQPTLRDQFAMAALSGMLGHPKCAVSEPEKDAKWAYKYADAMMEARYD